VELKEWKKEKRKKKKDRLKKTFFSLAHVIPVELI
jgi:hypothetical protein